MERLTASDLSMLWPEDYGWPQDVGALGVLEGSELGDSRGTFPIDALREDLERRLHPLPRLRQRIGVPRLGLGWPVWVDDGSFDVADHVGVEPVPPPGDEKRLLSTAEALFERPLDRRRPLWRLSFMPGLQRGEVGVLVKVHHAVADGMSGMTALGALCDASPAAVPPTPPPWVPNRPPSGNELLVDNLRRRCRSLGRATSSLAHPRATIRGARRLLPVAREAFGEGSAPRTSLNGQVGSGRKVALIGSDLELVKTIAHAHGGKVNDVLLAVVAAGLGDLLRSRGESVQGVMLRAFVPVSLHREEAGQEVGNRDGAIVVPLPIGLADDGARLRSIVAVTAARKRTERVPGAALFRNGIMQRAFLRLAAHQRFMNAYVANVPGPSVPLYLAGTRLRTLFPLVPLIGNLTLGVGALSYAGQFNITAVADRDACPDIEVFVEGVRRSLGALSKSRCGNVDGPGSIGTLVPGPSALRMGSLAS